MDPFGLEITWTEDALEVQQDILLEINNSQK